MIAEAALSLVQEVKSKGGVMTPAPAMAEVLIKRLEAHAGLTFAIEKG